MFYSNDPSLPMFPFSQPPPAFPPMPPQFQQQSGGYWMYCPAASNPDPAVLMRRNQARESKRAIMFKTVLCRQFCATGRCNYGDDCQYAHGEEDRRLPPPRHPKYRTEKCKNVDTITGCPYGARCHFLHEDPVDQQSQTSLSPQLPTDLTLSSGYGSTPFSTETSSPNPTQNVYFQQQHEFSNSPMQYFRNDLGPANSIWPSINSFATSPGPESFAPGQTFQYL